MDRDLIAGCRPPALGWHSFLPPGSPAAAPGPLGFRPLLPSPEQTAGHRENEGTVLGSVLRHGVLQFRPDTAGAGADESGERPGERNRAGRDLDTVLPSPMLRSCGLRRADGGRLAPSGLARNG